MNPVVIARGLRKSYGSFEAVKGIDFQIKENSCFGFLGPNGAGKTTTMAMIYCAGDITSGELTVLGLDPRAVSRKIKQQLGVAPQDDNLDPTLTIYENLWVYGHFYGIPRKILRPRIEELLELMQLTEKRKSTTKQLSGGMRKRLIIARSLLNAPKLLILDEPTTGLDPQARHLIWHKLAQLKRQGTTMILTTHYMDEAERLCDELVVMDHGKIIEQGNPAGLIKKHVGHDVVEINIYDKDPNPLLKLAAPYVSNSEIVGEHLYLYPPDPTKLINEILKVNSYEFTHRLATLEDLFLKLTGRELTE